MICIANLETVDGNFKGALADLRGGARDARPPGGSNSFIFMQFSTKNGQNNPNLRIGAPPSEKSWICHWGALWTFKHWLPFKMRVHNFYCSPINVLT